MSLTLDDAVVHLTGNTHKFKLQLAIDGPHEVRLIARNQTGEVWEADEFVAGSKTREAFDVIQDFIDSLTDCDDEDDRVQEQDR